MESCIYTGSVMHVRHEPLRHAFRYGIAFLYLDLDELPRAFEGSRLFGHERRAPATFRRADHFGDPAVPLDECVRQFVRAESGARPEGPIRLLTLPRVLGHVFNPISLYFCFDRARADLSVIVAEVTNTPWHERHCYVMSVNPAEARRDALRFRVPKALHVSPFLAMDYEYDWCISPPGERLGVSVANVREGQRVFEATLALERRTLDASGLRRAFWSQSLAPARVVAAIHWQALRLALRGAPFHAHPKPMASGAEEAA